MHFEELKCLLDEITQVEALPLTVVNLISNVCILGLEQIHDWKNLSVIWHKSFTNGIRAGNQSLQDFQSDSNVFWVSSVQGSLDWNNKLWNNW